MATTNGATNGATNGVSTNGHTNGVAKRQKMTDRKSSPIEEKYKDGFEFLRDLVEVAINDGVIGAMDRENKVCEFQYPEDLKATMKYLKIAREPESNDKLMEACKDFIKYSVKTTHPRFFNQLYGGMDPYSLAGAWLTEALNSSQYTYEVAPVFTLMEKEVYNKMLGFIGFDGGDAIFVPGGSVGNMYGMNLARYSKFPEVKTKGIYALPKPLCILTSEKGHYSMKKTAALLGLGTDCIISVKTDKKGKMLVADAEAKIQQATKDGFQPFFLNATAGTTVFGAYDPLDELGDLCKKYDLWMHVDGCWGGSAAISPSYRYLMKGIEKADSMAWNPHKMMGAPLQCAMFLTKHQGVLQDCHSAHARYLFQQDKHYDTSYDTGDKSVQCGRKIDVLKLWMLWKGKGDSGLESDIDHLFMLSRYLTKRLNETPGFRMILDPECTNVCFWYIPPSLRDQEETDEWWQTLGKVAPIIKERMMKCGSMMIGYNPDGNLVNFFRMVLSNFDTSTKDMDFLITEIDRLGNDL